MSCVVLVTAIVAIIVSAFGLSNNNKCGGCRLWQPVQADSQPKSSGLVLGWRPLGAVLHSSNEPGELSHVTHDLQQFILPQCIGTLDDESLSTVETSWTLINFEPNKSPASIVL